MTCPRSHRGEGRGQQPTPPRLTHTPRAEPPAHLQPATRDHRRGAARVPGLLRQPGLRQRDVPTAAPQEQPPKPAWRAQPPAGQVRPSPPPPPGTASVGHPVSYSGPPTFGEGASSPGKSLPLSSRSPTLPWLGFPSYPARSTVPTWPSLERAEQDGGTWGLEMGTEKPLRRAHAKALTVV